MNHELPNDLRLKSQTLFELLPSSQPPPPPLPPPEMKILPALVKSSEKQKLNFARSAPFHTETRVCPKYLGNDFSGNSFLLLTHPKIPSNLICLTIFVTFCNSKAFDTI